MFPIISTPSHTVQRCEPRGGWFYGMRRSDRRSIVANASKYVFFPSTGHPYSNTGEGRHFACASRHQRPSLRRRIVAVLRCCSCVCHFADPGPCPIERLLPQSDLVVRRRHSEDVAGDRPAHPPHGAPFKVRQFLLYLRRAACREKMRTGGRPRLLGRLDAVVLGERQKGWRKDSEQSHKRRPRHQARGGRVRFAARRPSLVASGWSRTHCPSDPCACCQTASSPFCEQLAMT